MGGSSGSERPSLRSLLKCPPCLAAFGFGLGLMPRAPGTFGTLLGVPLYWLFADATVLAYGLLVGALFLSGIALCSACARALHLGDHPGIVWDEIVGFLIAMWGVPWSWPNVMMGFVLFRFFDVVKPWPIRWVDRRVTGGLGIMLDDALAGAFAWGTLWAIDKFLAF